MPDRHQTDTITALSHLVKDMTQTQKGALYWAARTLGMLICTSLQAETWTVDPAGNDGAAGTPAAPFQSWQRAADVANPGDVIEVRSGRYDINAFRREGVFITRSGTQAAPITLRGVGATPPVLNCEQLRYSGSLYCINISANDWILERVSVRGAKQPSAQAFATGIQLTNSRRVRLTRLQTYENEGTGIRIVGDARDNVVDRCDSYRNYDPLNSGGNADGIAIAFTDVTATGNIVLASRAFENSDDGFDLFEAQAAVRLQENYAFRNGYIPQTTTTAGNGDGYKLGSNSAAPMHQIIRNLAFANRLRGFDANGASGPLLLWHNSAWQTAGPPFSLQQPVAHQLRNNLAFGGVNQLSSTVDVLSNSWTLPVFVDANDFESLDIAAAAAPRDSSGALPAATLLALRADSDLIDQGQVLAGSMFSGAAPDLGARERADVGFADGFE
jgi:hypothetical protein